MEPPSIIEIQSWSTPQLIKHLREECSIRDKHLEILETQEIDGESFLELTAEHLERDGMPRGSATKIIKYIQKIKGTSIQFVLTTHIC